MPTQVYLKIIFFSFSRAIGGGEWNTRILYSFVFLLAFEYRNQLPVGHKDLSAGNGSHENVFFSISKSMPARSIWNYWLLQYVLMQHAHGGRERRDLCQQELSQQSNDLLIWKKDYVRNTMYCMHASVEVPLPQQSVAFAIKNIRLYSHCRHYLSSVSLN